MVVDSRGDLITSPFLARDRLHAASNMDVVLDVRGDGGLPVRCHCSKRDRGIAENPFDFLGASTFSLPSLPPIDPFRNHKSSVDGFCEWLNIIICIPIALLCPVLFGLCLLAGFIATKIVLGGWKDRQDTMLNGGLGSCGSLGSALAVHSSVLDSFG